jgi:alpha-tubulin suppressor-like RCC1 family protein/putative flippase GtrA
MSNTQLTIKENWLQVLKFTLFSISAGLVQILTFTLLNELAKLPYWPAYLIALVLSVLWNFTFNRKFTFKSAANVPVAMLKVAVFYAVFSPLSTWWGDALTNIGWNEYVVLIGTMVINLVTEYLYARFFVYRNNMNTATKAKTSPKKAKSSEVPMNPKRIILIAVVSLLLVVFAALVFRGEAAISNIVPGEAFSIALRGDREIVVMGRNQFGQLGNGGTTNVSVPTALAQGLDFQSGESIESIHAGQSHTAILTSRGRVFVFGRNDQSQLGVENVTTQTTPLDITARFALTGNEKVVQLFAGRNHMFALTNRDRLFAWGRNIYGQLGNDTTTNMVVPTDITAQFPLAEDDAIALVATSERHTAVLSKRGRIFTFGYNGSGQLGDESSTNRLVPVEITDRIYLISGERFVSVVAGMYTTTLLTSKGRVFAMGNAIGDDSSVNRLVPTEITIRFGLEENEIIESIQSGGAATFALSSQGRVFSWGVNSNGQLGDGTTERRLRPVDITSRFALTSRETIVSLAVGSFHNFVITSKNRILGWGQNSSSQLGIAATTDAVVSPTECSAAFKPE